MTVEEIARSYYVAWQEQGGDFSEVPLAENFEFTGPVASFTSAEAYRQMASEAGQAVTRFEVRQQFVDGNSVCSIVDWEMAIPGLSSRRCLHPRRRASAVPNEALSSRWRRDRLPPRRRVSGDRRTLNSRH